MDLKKINVKVLPKEVKDLYEDMKEMTDNFDEDVMSIMREEMADLKEILGGYPEAVAPKKAKETKTKIVGRPSNMSQLKKWLNQNIGQTIYVALWGNPSIVGQPRKIDSVQTNSVTMTYDGRKWKFDYPKASDIIFSKIGFTIGNQSGFVYDKKDVPKQQPKKRNLTKSAKKTVERLKKNAKLKSQIEGRKESDIIRDAGRPAAKAGKRRTKHGTIYYENRANRSDVDPKGTMLKSGGTVGTIAYSPSDKKLQGIIKKAFSSTIPLDWEDRMNSIYYDVQTLLGVDSGDDASIFASDNPAEDLTETQWLPYIKRYIAFEKRTHEKYNSELKAGGEIKKISGNWDQSSLNNIAVISERLGATDFYDFASGGGFEHIYIHLPNKKVVSFDNVDEGISVSNGPVKNLQEAYDITDYTWLGYYPDVSIADAYANVTEIVKAIDSGKYIKSYKDEEYKAGGPVGKTVRFKNGFGAIFTAELVRMGTDKKGLKVFEYKNPKLEKKSSIDFDGKQDELHSTTLLQSHILKKGGHPKRDHKFQSKEDYEIRYAKRKNLNRRKYKKKSSLRTGGKITQPELLEIYNSLKKDDNLVISYDSVIRKGSSNAFIVTKGDWSGKSWPQGVSRVILVSKANPKGVKYYLYKRNGNISFAMGDMAATVTDISRERNYEQDSPSGSCANPTCRKDLFDNSEYCDEDCANFKSGGKINSPELLEQIKKAQKARIKRDPIPDLDHKIDWEWGALSRPKRTAIAIAVGFREEKAKLMAREQGWQDLMYFGSAQSDIKNLLIKHGIVKEWNSVEFTVKGDVDCSSIETLLTKFSPAWTVDSTKARSRYSAEFDKTNRNAFEKELKSLKDVTITRFNDYYKSGGTIAIQDHISFKYGRNKKTRIGQVLEIFKDGTYEVISGFKNLIVKPENIIGKYNRKWYSKYSGGGEIKFHDYKDKQIMETPAITDPRFKEPVLWWTNERSFKSLALAKKHIDNGSPLAARTINAYRQGAFKSGGTVEEETEHYRSVLQEAINADFIDEEHQSYDEVADALISNDPKKLKDVYEELDGAGLLPEEWEEYEEEEEEEEETDNHLRDFDEESEENDNHLRDFKSGGNIPYDDTNFFDGNSKSTKAKARGIFEKVHPLGRAMSKKSGGNVQSAAQTKFIKVMREFGKGELHQGNSGNLVTDRNQAVAIAYSEARKEDRLFGRYGMGGFIFGSVLGGYIGYKVGRSRPQNFDMQTEKAIARGIGKGAVKIGQGAVKGADRIKQRVAKRKRGGNIAEKFQYIPVNEIESIETLDGQIFYYPLSGAYIGDERLVDVNPNQIKLEFKDGGKLSDNARYIPSYKIKSIFVEDGDTIPGNQIVNGFWIDVTDRDQQLLDEYYRDQAKRKAKSTYPNEAVTGRNNEKGFKFGVVLGSAESEYKNEVNFQIRGKYDRYGGHKEPLFEAYFTEKHGEIVTQGVSRKKGDSWVVSIPEQPDYKDSMEVISDFFSKPFAKKIHEIARKYIKAEFKLGGTIEDWNGTFEKALVTDDFIYYVNREEGDENGNTKMFRKDESLVSDNYFANSDLFEVLESGEYNWISEATKSDFKEYQKESMKSGGKITAELYDVDDKGAGWLISRFNKAKGDYEYIVSHKPYETWSPIKSYAHVWSTKTLATNHSKSLKMKEGGKVNKPLNKYICTGCGTNYSTSEDKAPPTPKWSDGHVCKLVKNNGK